MDVETFLNDLRAQVSCPLCKSIFTDPKQLHCLHVFCLRCLKHRHETSHDRDIIKCPDCQALSTVPDSGDLKDLPTSYYLNGLIDVLAIKEQKTSQVRCGNCDKESSESFYCFHCRIFYCQECFTGHNKLRGNEDHRVLALKDFQDKDFEDVLKRPSFCQKEWHEKEELKYFCKTCEAALCQTCVLMDHVGHAMVHIDEEAERRKIEIESLIKAQKCSLRENMNTIAKIDEECAQVIQHGENVKRDVQKFVDKLIATIEAKTQNVLASVENEANRTIIAQKKEMENQLALLESSLERADKLLSRGTDIDVVQLSQFMESMFSDETDPLQAANDDPDRLPALVFVGNESLLETISAEGIGTLQS